MLEQGSNVMTLLDIVIHLQHEKGHITTRGTWRKQHD